MHTKSTVHGVALQRASYTASVDPAASQPAVCRRTWWDEAVFGVPRCKLPNVGHGAVHGHQRILQAAGLSQQQQQQQQHSSSSSNRGSAASRCGSRPLAHPSS
jgi:hypothetical protein